jgi:hypothetical protein
MPKFIEFWNPILRLSQFTRVMYAVWKKTEITCECRLLFLHNLTAVTASVCGG